MGDAVIGTRIERIVVEDPTGRIGGRADPGPSG
jgi:hypothetical protein